MVKPERLELCLIETGGCNAFRCIRDHAGLTVSQLSLFVLPVGNQIIHNARVGQG